MADTKISALTALTGANVDTAADVLPIVDTSASTTKKIVVNELRTALGPVLATEQASTSGTAIDFTSIPSWAKEIVILFDEVSTNGTSNILVQIGDSGGIETTGYRSTAGDRAAVASSTAGFIVANAVDASTTLSGQVRLNLQDASNQWVAMGTLARTDTANVFSSGGSKATSATLDRVRITTANGTDTFDAGAINVFYE